MTLASRPHRAARHPRRRRPVVTAWRAWLTLTVVLLAGPARADHSLPPVDRNGGLGWMTWALVAGAVLAVGLAAWAFFAPDRSERGEGPGH
jgi:hypothetical protein